MADPLEAWWTYLSLRTDVAIQAYDAAFTDDFALRADNPYRSIRDIHAFFTHAAMVARVFFPSPKRDKSRAQERAAILGQRVGIKGAALHSCLRTRHDLDHFDERIDAVLAQPGGFVAPATYVARTRDDLEHLGSRPALLMLVYLQAEHALVTYSATGDMTITPLGPIREELDYVRARSDDYLRRAANQPRATT